MSYIKFYKYKQQVSYDQGETWEDTGEYVPSGDPIGYYDTLEECMAQYRTIQSGTTCVGYDKHNQDVYEVSYDNGVTWSVVSTSAGTLIEADSPDCGYVPPTPASPKYVLTLNDSSTVSADCDSTSAITQAEISAYTSTTVSVEIGNCVNTIGQAAFYGCSGLTSVTIPDSVTTIGQAAFNKCSGLTSIYIPNSVNTISGAVFGDCSSLTSVNIPSGITMIGNSTFYGCSSLTDITIPDNVQLIDTAAFENCTSLSSVTIGSGVTTIGSGAFEYCSRLTNIVIPNSVNTIDTSAFYGCSSLTSVTIGNNVVSIGDTSFNYCVSLTGITIPDSVTSIGNYAFMRCSGLTSVIIGSGVTSIGNSVFRYCSGLTSITVNATTPPTLGSNVFYNNNAPIYVPCASVDTYKAASGWSTYASRIEGIPPCGSPTFNGKYQLTLNNSNIVTAACDSTSSVTQSEIGTQYSGSVVSAEIGDCVTSIGDRAFYRCSSLTSVTIPDSVTSIGNHAFNRCSGLTSVTIPDSVTYIGPGAFIYCSSLTSVTIPSGVTSIGSSAFRDCSGLTSITVNATTPPSLGASTLSKNTFQGSTCPIYVPSTSVNDYKAASGWSDYASRIQAIP